MPTSSALPTDFHWLTVADVRRETDHACSVHFAVDNKLRSQFAFKAGQYLTLLKEIDGEPLRRPYSLCVSPAEDELRICAKEIPAGRMSGYINNTLKVGDQVAVMVPHGRFYNEIDPSATHHYVGIAGGSGITPILSLLSTVLEEEKGSSFTLIYGNRTSADIIFRERLNDLKNRFLGRLQVLHILSEESTDVPLFHGLLDSERIESIVAGLTEPQHIDTFFICGPGPMMDGAESALQRLHVQDNKIKIESFGSGAGVHAGALNSIESVSDDTPRAQALIKRGGKSQTVGVPVSHSILDAALAASMDLPFACKGGVCCTCKARLLDGSVSMAVNYGLEQDEIDAGFILTCQARPTSDTLTIDYDI